MMRGSDFFNNTVKFSKIHAREDKDGIWTELGCIRDTVRIWHCI